MKTTIPSQLSTAGKYFDSLTGASYLILFVLLTLISCSNNDKLEFNDVPVVESYLTSNKPVSLQISRKTAYDENVALSADDINALQVKIKYDNQTRIIPPSGNGLYTDSNFIPREGTTYQLEFTFNSKTVTSSTQIPSKPVNYEQSVSSIEIQGITVGGGFGGGPGGVRPQMPDPVKLTWTNDDAGYYMVVIENIETAPIAINDFGGSEEDAPRRVFRNEPTQSNQYEIAAMNFQYYGRHRLILFHLNAEYAALYNNNGTTSQNLTNPVTNVDNGLGIFTGINADTLMIDVTEP
jgi:hypothetical protein